MTNPYDAILIVSFGGPEKRDDVIPFLQNVLRGRNVPRRRMQEVAAHYDRFDGVSPINEQVRELMRKLRDELDRHGIDLPLFWGNRNWHPLLPDTLQQMKEAGVRRALAVVLSAYSSYSGCRQYLDDVEQARAAVGAGAPVVDKVRAFFNHPQFVAANADNFRQAIAQFDPSQQETVHVIFTAHSIPVSMAANCEYAAQLTETCRLIAEEERGLLPERWELAYQSRSGRPTDPWLEPDISDALTAAAGRGVENVVVMPVGFLSDHLEILYDLDVEAREVAEKLGVHMVRATSVGTHPRFVSMLRELIQERTTANAERRSVGRLPPLPDVCPHDCCPLLRARH